MRRLAAWLQGLRWRLFQNSVADQYFMRYIEPEIKRARALGIPGGDLREMWNRAVEDADSNTGIGAAARLTSLIDQWHFGRLATRARDLGVPQYVFVHTWSDAMEISSVDRPALCILERFLDNWEAGNVHPL